MGLCLFFVGCTSANYEKRFVAGDRLWSGDGIELRRYEVIEVAYDVPFDSYPNKYCKTIDYYVIRDTDNYKTRNIALPSPNNR